MLVFLGSSHKPQLCRQIPRNLTPFFRSLLYCETSISESRGGSTRRILIVFRLSSFLYLDSKVGTHFGMPQRQFLEQTQNEAFSFIGYWYMALGHKTFICLVWKWRRIVLVAQALKQVVVVVPMLCIWRKVNTLVSQISCSVACCGH